MSINTIAAQIRIPNINKSPNTTTQSQPTNRVAHQKTLKKELLEAGYSVNKIGQNSSHTFYRIIGHIYNLSNEEIYGHNRRLIMFQIEGWDSGFLNDNLQSIDGYPTQFRLNNQGVLYQFGNSKTREFAFDFKVKRGQQHLVRAELIPDWAPLERYEPYLLIEYSSLSGTYEVVGNQDISFKIEFSPQGDQIAMEDFYKQKVIWIKKEEKTYVRMLGEVPNTNTTNNTNGWQPNSSSTTNESNKPSDYPSGGYLGNSNNSNTTQKPKDYPSGGYLGELNSNNSNDNSYPGSANQAQIPQQAYSSVIQIVDRKTLKYFNSEGIAIELKRKEGM